MFHFHKKTFVRLLLLHHFVAELSLLLGLKTILQNKSISSHLLSLQCAKLCVCLCVCLYDLLCVCDFFCVKIYVSLCVLYAYIKQEQKIALSKLKTVSKIKQIVSLFSKHIVILK